MRPNTHSFATKMEFTRIRKGRGFVYAHENNLYHQVKKWGAVTLLKCCVENCDGSAKLEDGEFKRGVSTVHLL